MPEPRSQPLPILGADHLLLLPGPRRSPVRAAVVAVALAATAVALTALFEPLAASSTFLLAFGAVTAAGWYGGGFGGLVATLVSVLLIDYYVLPPTHHFFKPGETDLVRLLTFMALALVTTAFNESLHVAARRLRSSEYLSRIIVEDAPLLIAAADEAGRIVLFNRACERATGYRQAEMLGRQLLETLVAESWRSEVAARFASRTDETLAEPHRNAWTTEAGQERLIEWRCYRVPARDGRMIIGLGYDVTEQERMENELQQTLQREAEARRAAVAATLARERFIAALSHELRTPLNAILGWTSVLRSRADREEVAHALDSIQRSGQLIDRLVGDVLDLSRVDAGKIALKPQRVDLAAIARAAAESIAPLAQSREITVDLTADAAPHDVDGDPDRLQQMTLNLLSNALKFTPNGGRISVRTSAAGGFVECAVIDSGAGIDPLHAAKAFEPFWQGDADRGGLGLGLALVQQLATLHGGSASIARAGDGGGTIAAFRLPAAHYVEEEMAG